MFQIGFERRKDTERKDAKYRITIGSYFQDLTQTEAESLFEKMCDNLQDNQQPQSDR